MPNSLRCKIKHLCHNGTLTERERDRILKALEQEPKIGHWEMCEDPDGIYGVCSECGQDADFSHYGKAYCFCPNCGAKMESEDKE